MTGVQRLTYLNKDLSYPYLGCYSIGITFLKTACSKISTNLIPAISSDLPATLKQMGSHLD